MRRVEFAVEWLTIIHMAFLITIFKDKLWGKKKYTTCFSAEKKTHQDLPEYYVSAYFEVLVLLFSTCNQERKKLVQHLVCKNVQGWG